MYGIDHYKLQYFVLIIRCKLNKTFVLEIPHTATMPRKSFLMVVPTINLKINLTRIKEHTRVVGCFSFLPIGNNLYRVRQ